MNAPRTARRRPRPAEHRGVLSYELLFVLPIVLALIAALVEFSLLWSAAHKVHLSAQAACRVATRPCEELALLDRAVRDAAAAALVDRRLAASHRLTLTPGAHTGDPVVVEVRVPMKAASPDLLAMFGFSLQDRYLTSRVVMSKE